MIYILTGSIRSGKTSALLEWVNGKNKVDGLLCPDDENGIRYCLKIKLNEVIKLEAENKTEEIIEIGNFKFLTAAFYQANAYLISITSETENDFIIIDELGKLELKNEGLHTSAEILISKLKKDNATHAILVVRDYLVGAILKHYHIADYTILKKDDLKSLR
ncbi:nucleoside-triphosphatase [Lacinutrix chionoecetis]